jgi:RNA polymerase sigma factor (TIGR02999 family)
MNVAPQATARLLPLVYDEVRRLAAAKLALEPDGHSLQATALVHEVYLRLGAEETFETKSAFMRAAAEAMRRVLVDHARAKRAEKRGGDRKRVSLLDLASPSRDADLLALDEALSDLGRHDPVAAEFVKLRYFSGCSHSEAGATLGLSRRQADGLWALARAWLFDHLQRD